MEQRDAEQAALQRELIGVAREKDPLEERLRGESLAFLDWESGKGGPVDIEKAPGMGAYLDIYNRARERRSGERMGQGLLSMGQSSPEHAALLREQRDAERQTNAAGELENAFRMRSAEARGSVLPLAGMRHNTNMGLASLASGNANAATNNYLQFLMRPRKPSIWSQLWGTAQQAAQAKAQAGCTTLDTPILTPEGFRPLGEVEEGDLVLGVDSAGLRKPLPVTRRRVAEDSETVEVRFEGGAVLECSPSHRLLLALDDRTETPVSRMGPGWKVLGAEGGLLTIRSVTPTGRRAVGILKLGAAGENFAYVTGGVLSLDDYAVRSAAV